MLLEVVEWARAVLGQWQALVTGGIVTALFIAVQSYRGKPFSWRVSRWIFLAFLVAALFLAWRAQRIAFRNAQTELADIKRELNRERDRNAPKLIGEIGQTLTFDVQLPDGRAAGLLLWVSIRNLGMDSVVTDYDVTLNFPDGRTLRPQSAMVPKNIVLSDLGMSMKDASAGALYEKTIESPIVHGGSRSGLLLFTMRGVRSDDLRIPGTRLVLSFRDVIGRPYTASMQFPSGNDRGKYQYCPGTPPIKPTMKKGR